MPSHSAALVAIIVKENESRAAFPVARRHGPAAKDWAGRLFIVGKRQPQFPVRAEDIDALRIDLIELGFAIAVGANQDEGAKQYRGKHCPRFDDAKLPLDFAVLVHDAVLSILPV